MGGCEPVGEGLCVEVVMEPLQQIHSLCHPNVILSVDKSCGTICAPFTEREARWEEKKGVLNLNGRGC